MIWTDPQAVYESLKILGECYSTMAYYLNHPPYWLLCMRTKKPVPSIISRKYMKDLHE